MAFNNAGARNDNNDGDYNNGEDSGFENWWWSPAGLATRYAIVAVLFGSLLIFFVGGYYHAQRRMRKGLPPLAYHRWIVRRQYNNTPQPRYAYPQYSNNQGYGMENYPPPPAYNSAEAPPPVYQPPPGASKVMADQSFGDSNRVGEGSSSGGLPLPAAAARQ